MTADDIAGDTTDSTPTCTHMIGPHTSKVLGIKPTDSVPRNMIYSAAYCTVRRSPRGHERHGIAFKKFMHGQRMKQSLHVYSAYQRDESAGTTSEAALAT